ncbi:MAG: hypothetical protein ABXS93_08945 [Sulfurimonas sp.]
MDQMYTMGVTIHSMGVLALIFAIMINAVLLYQADDSQDYKRLRSIILLPLNSMLIAIAIFTGAIMMAAKHLHFTAENFIMIFIALLLITKEVRRSKLLNYVDDEDYDDFLLYKKFAYKLIVFEFITVVTISVWMWFFA